MARPWNTPKKPASARSSGKFAEAAFEYGNTTEYHSTANSTAARDIQRSSGERREVWISSKKLGRLLKREPCRFSSLPSSDLASRKLRASPAIPAKSRFSVPIQPTSGRVLTPPTASPRVLPAPNNGNKRLDWRI